MTTAKNAVQNNPQNQDTKACNYSAEDIVTLVITEHDYFHDSSERAFVTLNGKVFPVDSERFKDTIRVYNLEETSGILSEAELSKAVTTLRAIGRIQGDERKIFTRIAEVGKAIEYDLCQKSNSFVRVIPGKYGVVNNCKSTFYQPFGMNPQVAPEAAEPHELLEFLNKYFRLNDDKMLILLACYLLACFIPHIQHPLLMFHGNKGAAKTTALKVITRIVDPRSTSVSTLPKSRDDLALILGQSYLTGFDNLRNLSRDNSDLLCVNCTGGSNTKRRLYTDSELVSTDLSCIVVLNGIEIVGTQPDLLDRSIVFRLERIPDDERKTESEIMAEFTEDLPKILGAIFKTLSLALGKVGKVKLSSLPRMAEFAQYGYAFAAVLTGNGNDFIAAYNQNLKYVQGLIAESEPTVATVMAFMENRAKFEGAPTKLLKELDNTAIESRIDISRHFPASASALSNRLDQVKDDLKNMGIDYRSGYFHKTRRITLINKKYTAPTTPPAPTANKRKPKKTGATKE